MYPIDRRKMALRIYSFFNSLRKTAVLLQVSHSTISRWLKNQSRKQYTKTKNKIYKSDVIIETIRIAIHNDPFISITKLSILLKETMHITVSKELVRLAIAKLGLSKKKARFYGEPNNLKEKTTTFLEHRDAYIKQNRRFLSIDETSFGRNGINTFGYSKIGSPLYIKKKQARMTTTSSVCCTYSDGTFVNKNIYGSFNTERFSDFLNTLDTQKNDVILMDNVRFHHSKSVAELLKRKNVDILFVPPYSPWFNPIELCFSIVKREYYKSQDIAKSYSALTCKHILSFFKKSLHTYGAF
jgi:transposase